MKKLLAAIAIAALSAGQALAIPVIQQGFAGGISIDTKTGLAHGGSLGRFTAAGPSHGNADPGATNGISHLHDTALGAASGIGAMPGPVTSDFLALFELADITSTIDASSVLDIPAGKRIVGAFYGTNDISYSTSGGTTPQVVLQSSGGRMEFYLVNTGADPWAGSGAGTGLSKASFDAAGRLTYAGVTTGTKLFAFNLVAGELQNSDLPLLDGLGAGVGAIGAATTELRAINTAPGSNSGNNGAFYARIDKTFGDVTLANRLDNGGFGKTLTADFSGDYTMNPTSPLQTSANSFSLRFNDPIATTVTAIPEPSTILLLGTGLVGLVAYRRRNA